MNQDHKNRIVYWSVSLASAAVILLLIGLAQGVSLRGLIRGLLGRPGQCNYNFCDTGYLGDIPVNCYLYVLITVSAVIIAFIFRIVPRFLGSSRREDFWGILRKVTIISIVIYMATQTVHRFEVFFAEYPRYSGKRLEDRLPESQRYIYQFASFCRREYPGRHAARLVTDLNMTEDPGMFYQRALAYYLYPIDIRVHREEVPDCVIVFEKENPLNSIPEGFKLLKQFDGFSLLAVRED